MATGPGEAGGMSRRGALAAAGAVLLSGWLAALLMILPLRGELRAGAERELLDAHALQARGIANLLLGMRDVAFEVTRRPQMREHLEACARGEESRESAVAATRPELEAALRQFPGLAGISRHDARGAVLAQAGNPTPVAPWPVSARLLDRAPEAGILRLGQRSFLGVSAPIASAAGERIGTDVLLYELAPLQELLTRVPDYAAEPRSVLGARERERWWDLMLPPAGDGSNALPEGSPVAAAMDASARGSGLLRPKDGGAPGRLLAYGRIPGQPWALVLPADAGRLYRVADRRIVRPALPALAASLVLAAAAWFLCGRRARRPSA